MCSVCSNDLLFFVLGFALENLVIKILSYENINPVRLGSLIMTSFNLNYFMRGPISKYNHTGGGSWLKRRNFGGRG